MMFNLVRTPATSNLLRRMLNFCHLVKVFYNCRSSGRKIRRAAPPPHRILIIGRVTRGGADLIIRKDECTCGRRAFKRPYYGLIKFNQ
jgi:hypothetical protein